MRKILSITLFYLLFLHSGAHAEEKVLDSLNPGINIEFNNVETITEEIRSIEKDFEDRTIQINYTEESLGDVVVFGIVFALLLIFIGIVCLIFWISMIIHAISKPINQKAIWILILLLFGIIGAIIYYFAVKKDFTNKNKETLKAEKVD